jgi:hypothetical protein
MRIEKNIEQAIVVVLASLLMFGGCSSQTCTPQTYQSCVGRDACNGVQTCAADGSTWSLCDCGIGLDGTGGSSGGTSDSGTSAATTGGFP